MSLCVLVAWTQGCADAPSEPASTAASPAEPGPPGQPAENVDALRAVPYLNFSAEQADPAERGVMSWDERRAYPGYSLYTLRGLRAAELIDMRGVVVNRWAWSGGGIWQRTDLLPNGDVLVAGRESGTSYLLRLNFDNQVVWKRALRIHHDVEQTPSGQLLAITQRHRHETIDGEAMRVRDDHLTLLDQAGKEIASVSLYDAFRRAEARSGKRILEVVRTGQGEALDFFHANSVEWMNRPHLFGTHALYDSRHVLVSVKHQDLVAILDWDQQEVVWWWGRGELDGQHDASLLENGNLLIFDNGLRRKWGRALEIDPRTDEVVWQYAAEPRERLYTHNLGSAQRLPNGNTLIGESERGHAFEVTSAGNVVWDFRVPHINRRGHRAVFVRMVRYEKGPIEDLLRARRRRPTG